MRDWTGKSLSEKILDRCVPEPNSGCWIWIGCYWKDGYALYGTTSGPKKAHRLSYEAFNNVKIPPGMFCCHKCDTPACVNPAHLFLGTAKQNTMDMIKKGRKVDGHAKRTHCKNGHPYKDNLKPHHSGARQCRICSNASSARYYKRKMLSKLSAK